MAYAGNAMMEALRRDRVDPYGIDSPIIIKYSISALLMFGVIPCAIWPVIYVGLYDGWIAAVVWLILQVLGTIGAIVLGIRG